MQSLSKLSEQRLLQSLEKVAALTNDGVNPNEAIIKIAEEEKLPSGHVRLMVNAHNTGATNAHRLSTDDPLEKAAEFPLASADVVLRALYPNEVQTKAATFVATTISNEYQRSPRWLKEKAASVSASRQVTWKMTDKKPVVERDPTTAMKKAMATIQKSNQDIELQRMELTRQRDTAIKLATALRTYFATPGHIPFEEVTSNSNILFGKSAAIILDAVKPTKEGTIKQASVPVNLTAAPYSLVKQAIELASTFVTKREAYNAAVKTAYDESSQLLRPFGRTPAQGLSVMADLCSPQIKHGGFSDLVRSGFGVMTAGNIGQEIARKVPGTQPTTALEQGDLSSLMDPAHEREIRNIQSEAMLNDLIANDDVIRGYDPEEAVDAFNEISQLAPYSSNTKVIMRDLMRKRLAGGASALDQFTVGDTLGQQQKLRDLNTPNEPRMNALKDLGVMSRAQPSVIGGHKPH